MDLDDSVWGNTAEITAVSLFEYIEVTNKLGLNEPVTGIQQRSVSATVVINKDNAGISGTIGENPNGYHYGGFNCRFNQNRDSVFAFC